MNMQCNLIRAPALAFGHYFRNLACIESAGHVVGLWLQRPITNFPGGHGSSSIAGIVFILGRYPLW